jgi:hypothetical protein
VCVGVGVGGGGGAPGAGAEGHIQGLPPGRHPGAHG